MSSRCKGHTTVAIEGITFCSDFDNGNLKAVEKIPRNGYDYQIWTASDNCGTQYETGHSSWFYFSVTGLPKNSTIRFVRMILVSLMSLETNTYLTFVCVL